MTVHPATSPGKLSENKFRTSTMQGFQDLPGQNEKKPIEKQRRHVANWVSPFREYLLGGISKRNEIPLLDELILHQANAP